MAIALSSGPSYMYDMYVTLSLAPGASLMMIRMVQRRHREAIDKARGRKQTLVQPCQNPHSRAKQAGSESFAVHDIEYNLIQHGRVYSLRDHLSQQMRCSPSAIALHPVFCQTTYRCRISYALRPDSKQYHDNLARDKHFADMGLCPFEMQQVTGYRLQVAGCHFRSPLFPSPTQQRRRSWICTQVGR